MRCRWCGGAAAGSNLQVNEWPAFRGGDGGKAIFYYPIIPLSHYPIISYPGMVFVWLSSSSRGVWHTVGHGQVGLPHCMLWSMRTRSAPYSTRVHRAPRTAAHCTASYATCPQSSQSSQSDEKRQRPFVRSPQHMTDGIWDCVPTGAGDGGYGAESGRQRQRRRWPTADLVTHTKYEAQSTKYGAR